MLTALKSSSMNIFKYAQNLYSGLFQIYLMAYSIYRSSKNITRNSNWRCYHWCPQPINLDMFSRRKPITKIPMAAKTANSAGKKRFHFISNGLGVINLYEINLQN